MGCVAETGGVANQLAKTSCRVARAGCVGQERLLSSGRVKGAGCVAVERDKTARQRKQVCGVSQSECSGGCLGRIPLGSARGDTRHYT